MTTATATLTDFLLARIAEDEAAAHYALTRDPVDDRSPGGWGGWWIGHYHHYHRHDPARVLAECEAKRRIVGTYEQAEAEAVSEYPDPARYAEQAAVGAAEDALCALAAVYADHPDYREEWRP